MTRRIFQRPLAGIALGIAGVYMTLALMAAGCLFAHAASADGHHQHSGQHSGAESHSPLCSWACQATSDVGPTSQAVGGMVWAVQVHTAVSSPLLIAVRDQSSLHARAPPVPARG